MVSRVAGTQIAEIFRLVVAMITAEGTQADRRQQLLAGDLKDGFPSGLVKNRMFERNGEQLIRSAGGIVTAFAVNDIIEVTAVGVPKSLVKGPARALGLIGKFGSIRAVFCLQPALKKFERAVPEGVDLDGFSAPWSDDPIVHFCVHPGKLVAFGALAKEPVVRIDSDAETGSTQMMVHDVEQLGEDKSQSGFVVS